MGALSAFLHSGQAINVVFAVLTLLTGLYGFESILANRGGVLRQIIVAIPAALLYALSAYLLNILSHDFYAHVYRTLFSLRSTQEGLQLFAIQVALYGFMLPFFMPNMYRKTSDYGDYSMPYLVIYVLLQTASKTMSFAILLLIANTAHRLPFGAHLSNAGVFITSVIFAAITIPASIKATSVFSVQWALRSPRTSQKRQQDSRLARTPGCLLFLVLVVTLYLTLIAISVVGWAAIVYILALFILYRLISALQHVADSMSPDALRKVFLALFLLYCLLLLGQAIL